MYGYVIAELVRKWMPGVVAKWKGNLHGVGARWKGNLHGVGARIIGWKLLTLRDDKHARHSLWVGQRRYIMHVTRHAASTESENPWSCYTYCFREREDVEPPGRHSCTKTKCMSRVFNACHIYSMHVTCIRYMSLASNTCDMHFTVILGMHLE